MRRASIRMVTLGLAATALGALGLPAGASAKPVVTVKVKILPILKNPANRKAGFWPHTGNFLGAPAALETRFLIKGSEYGGFPAPLRRVAVYLPKGAKVSTAGFPTCALSLLENKEPEKCPKGSLASPAGFAPQSTPENCPPPSPLAGGASEGCGVVSFGGTRVHEAVKVQAYFAPNGLNFYLEGVTPASIELPFGGKFSGAGGAFGTKFLTNIPLIETVPGALFGSSESATVTIGAAMKKGKKLLSLGTLPKTCPKGGFPGKGEMWFGAGDESTWENVTINVKVPCPRH